MKIAWDDEYLSEEEQIPCPQINPDCTTIPLIHPLCPCELIYSIPYVNLDLEILKNIHVTTQERSIIITPQMLFDCGHLR